MDAGGVAAASRGGLRRPGPSLTGSWRPRRAPVVTGRHAQVRAEHAAEMGHVGEAKTEGDVGDGAVVAGPVVKGLAAGLQTAPQDVPGHAVGLFGEGVVELAAAAV